MDPITADDPLAQSADIVAENIERLQELFPEAFTEGQIDFDVLKQLLGGAVDEREEKYGLNWHGKRRARQLALTPSTGTLRPCPEESVDWDTTQNLMIEGDNLEVLKLLQKSYAGKVKLIYIDPPYNTGHDFVYPDDFQDNIRNYQMLTGQVDSDGRKMSSNTETSGRFHTDWLNMMYPRLCLARSLLADNGVIFISIDDGECDRLRLVCEDIFGGENFLGTVTWQKKYAPANDTIDFSASHDYVLVFAKRRPQNSTGRTVALLEREARTDEMDDAYQNKDDDPRGPWKSGDYTCNKSAEERPNLFYPITNPNTGEEVWPKRTRVWGYGPEQHAENVRDKRVWWGENGTNRVPAYKRFLSEVQGTVAQTIWTWDEVGHTDEAKKELLRLFDESGRAFETPKPTRLIRRMIRLAASGDDNPIVLDFFAGSGTTAHALWAQFVEDQIDRRLILVQLPHPTGRDDLPTISDLTKERLRRTGQAVKEENPLFAGDVGFRVFKLDASNIRVWEPDAGDLDGTLDKYLDHIRDDRSEQDVLYELLLKLGLDLCTPIEQQTIAGKTVHSIGAGTLIACLATKITRDDVEELAQGIITWHTEQAPSGETTVVFRDSAFADDVAKTNLTAILQQHGLANVRSL